MDERKAFEAAYNAIPPITSTRETAWLIWQAATLAERERAAKAAQDFLTSGRSPLGLSVAAAIRKGL